MTIRITAITPDGERRQHPSTNENGHVELVTLEDGSFQVIGELRSGRRQLLAEYPVGTEFIVQ